MGTTVGTRCLARVAGGGQMRRLAKIDALIKGYKEALENGNWQQLAQLDADTRAVVEATLQHAQSIPASSDAVTSVQSKLQELFEHNQRAVAFATSERGKMGEQLRGLGNAKVGIDEYTSNAKL